MMTQNIYVRINIFIRIELGWSFMFSMEGFFIHKSTNNYT